MILLLHHYDFYYETITSKNCNLIFLDMICFGAVVIFNASGL